MSETGLPTGTVTFLLTDVESSSARWETHPEAMASAIARHYGILDAAIVGAGGVRPVEQGEGDSVVGAFRHAIDAVAAAAAAQRALHGEAWPAGAELKVRMAIHTGAAQLRDEGNYFGPTIIRCARLRACASGGQILVSRSAADLVSGALPAGVTLVNVGRHRLKDLSEPEDVWQLSIEGLPDSFAPIQSRGSGRDTLPTQSTPLIGRLAELDELEAVASEERLVTLTGSGGCGKTRLAAELAGRMMGNFANGVVWLELAPYGDIGPAVSLLATALGVADSPGEPLIDRVLEALHRRDGLLVVFDNAEHLLDPTAQIVDALLRVDHVTVVVTSREPLGLAGEVVWRVPSLSSPSGGPGAVTNAATARDFEAVQLFVDRARRASREFTLDDDNAPAVARICERLDGLPLAIELAAARVRTMPVERIAAQLDDRFRLLAGGARTALPRQQTLLASIAWSDGLLDDDDRAVFRHLGAFVGGFTADAARNVVAAAIDADMDAIDEAVARLVDKSLVHFDLTADRYVMLETIRAYALDRLIESGAAAPTRDACAAWYAQWLDELTEWHGGATAAVEWLRRTVAVREAVRPEQGNLNAALGWVEPGSNVSLRLVAGIAAYWLAQRGDADSVQFGMPALRLGDRNDPAWLRAVVAMHGVRTNAGDAEYDVIKHEARAIAESAGIEQATIRLADLQSVFAMRSEGPTDELVAQMYEAIPRAEDAGEWYTAINLLGQGASLLQMAGRVTEARRLLGDHPSDRSDLHRSSCDQLQGHMAASLDRLRRVHQRFISGEAPDTELGIFELRAATLVLATGWTGVGTGLALPRQVTARDYIGVVHYYYDWTVGLRQLADGDVAGARQTIAPTVDEGFMPLRGGMWVLQLDMALGDLSAARERLDAIRSRWQHLDAPLVAATIDLVAAELARADGRDKEALEFARRSLMAAASEQLWPSAVDAIEAIGVLQLERGQAERAARLLGAGATARDEMAYNYRFPHRADYVRAARATVEVNAAFDAGRSTSRLDAVELACAPSP